MAGTNPLSSVQQFNRRLRRTWAATRDHGPDGPGVPPAAAPPAREAPDEVPEWLLRDQRDGENMRRLVAFVLAPDSNCIDVGAHQGGLLSEMVRVAPDGRHIAFEPLPHLAAALREQFPAVEVHQAAASNTSGEATFAHVRAAEGWSGLVYRPLPGDLEPDLQEIVVRLEPIDDVVDHSRPPSLIKIDVEGAEQQVFEGAIRTLRTFRPVVIFEHGHGSAEHFGTGPADIFGFLEQETPLRVFDLDGNGPYSASEFERTFHACERVNFVARP